MDDWEAVLRPMCKSLINKNESGVICLPLYQRVGMEVINSDQEGLWSGNHEGVVIMILKSLWLNFFHKDIEMSR